MTRNDDISAAQDTMETNENSHPVTGGNESASAPEAGEVALATSAGESGLPAAQAGKSGKMAKAESTAPPARPRTPLLVRAPLLLIVGAYLLSAVAMLGTRWGLWSFPRGSRMLGIAVWIAVATLVTSGLAIYRLRGKGLFQKALPLAVVGLIASLILVVVPWAQSRVGANAPLIHDITTDTQNPPTFEAIIPLREGAANRVEYSGGDVARLQNEAYPDIRPVILDLSFSDAYQRARELAELSGWRIVEANEMTGRIEATARTRWFGLPEDVVVRLTPLEGRTVVDVRSTSRQGEGDRGTNARRVQEYLAAIRP
jgi:uncharacterized protein (DUF1499 family)